MAIDFLLAGIVVLGVLVFLVVCAVITYPTRERKRQRGVLDDWKRYDDEQKKRNGPLQVGK